VFNLTKYRFLFLMISLLVLIPGIISLVLNGLNRSTEFTGGTQISLRPQTAIKSTAEIEQLLDNPKNNFKLDSLHIVLGGDKSLPANPVWIKLSPQIDTNVENALKKYLEDVNKEYGNGTLSYETTKFTAGKTSYVIYQVKGFKNTPKIDKDALEKSLPKTGPANVSITPTPQPTPTQSVTTPTPQATVTPSETTPTPEPTATPSVTATPQTDATTAVKVEDIQVGTTNQTIEITTRTQIDKADFGNAGRITFPQIQQAILNQQPHQYVTIVKIEQTGPSVSGQTTRNAILAVIVASILILFYIWFSFRKVPKAIRYATSAIIALVHDILVLLGVFSILGEFAGIQIDGLFITALLTVVGFSIHDTIVVFDRIRENMQRHPAEDFEEVVNASLVQTMARSLNTSLTVLFTLLALTLFTADNASLHSFTLALLVGIASGTYSSIFNASMILVVWEKGELGFKRFGGGRQNQTPTRREQRKRELAETR
jgi:preprotein translocase SecF subunit